MENRKLKMVSSGTARCSKTIILFSIFQFLFSSCTNPSKEASLQKPYFDLTAFFSGQITQLEKDSMIVVKTSAINTNTDEHTMPWADWKREFALFIASDINKTAFIGKYVVDTVLNPGGKTGELTVRYSATDSSLRTKLMEVTWLLPEKNVKQIHIINRSCNFLSTTHEELFYLPMKAYMIRSSQDMKFFSGTEYSLMGQIKSKEKNYF